MTIIDHNYKARYFIDVDAISNKRIRLSLETDVGKYARIMSPADARAMALSLLQAADEVDPPVVGPASSLPGEDSAFADSMDVLSDPAKVNSITNLQTEINNTRFQGCDREQAARVFNAMPKKIQDEWLKKVGEEILLPKRPPVQDSSLPLEQAACDHVSMLEDDESQCVDCGMFATEYVACLEAKIRELQKAAQTISDDYNSKVELITDLKHNIETMIRQADRNREELQASREAGRDSQGLTFNAGSLAVIELIEPILGGKYRRGEEMADEYVKRQIEPLRSRIHELEVALTRLGEATVMGSREEVIAATLVASKLLSIYNSNDNRLTMEKE